MFFCPSHPHLQHDLVFFSQSFPANFNPSNCPPFFIFLQGQHTCAQVIKNFFSLSDLEVYTVPQGNNQSSLSRCQTTYMWLHHCMLLEGVDQKPIISPSLVPLLHSLVIFVEIHPVWVRMPTLGVEGVFDGQTLVCTKL